MDIINSNFFDNYFYGDNNEYELLVDEIAKYDIYNFISRISCLNLLSENQNKAILLDSIIERIISKERECYISNKIMSAGKFKSIIKVLNSSNLSYSIDPCDNVFAQKIIFNNKEYYVFNGIDASPAYNLQALIKVLFVYKNNFNGDFLVKSFLLCDFILEISNKIFEQLNIKINDIKYDESKEILLPFGEKISEYSKIVVIKENEYIKYINEWLSIDDFVTEFGSKSENNINNKSFYKAPFIFNTNDNSLIILNISLLPYFVISKILNWAEDYGMRNLIIGRLNDFIWMNVLHDLDLMGHHQLKANQFGIELINKPFYKEQILSVYNNQIMMICFIADDCECYDTTKIHEKYPSRKHSIMINDRLSYLSNKFKEKKVNYDNVYLIIIFQSLGREISIIGCQFYSKYNPIHITPFELHCIFINEEKNKNFLPLYIVTKNYIRMLPFELNSELNIVAFFTDNEYSFYMDDNVDFQNVDLYFESGYSISYINKALDKEGLELANSYNDNEIVEIKLVDATRKIYCTDNLFFKNDIALFVKSKCLGIWVIARNYNINNKKEIGVYQSITDMITYWLGEYGFVFDKLLGNVYKYPIIIEVSLIDNAGDFFVNIDDDFEVKECITSEIQNNHIYLKFKSSFYSKMNKTTNISEKEFFVYLIELISLVIEQDCFNKDDVSFIFSNPLKKKFFTLSYYDKPYLKPLNIHRNVRVRSELEDHLCDYIGRTMLNSKKWQIGIVSYDDRFEVSKEAVSILYKKLQSKLEDISSQGVIETIYLDLEITLNNLMIMEKRYYSDVMCYPELQHDYNNEYNELNKVSVALKFLIEYVTARPCKGQRVLGEGEYEELIAICSSILDWAYKGDMFKYNMIDSSIEFLKSKRIGLKRKKFEEIYSYGEIYRTNMLSYNSSNEIRKEYSISKEDFSDDFLKAFQCEFGYSYLSFMNIINSLININDKEIACMQKDVVIKKIVSNSGLAEEEIERVLDDITYTEREDYLKLPDKYHEWEALPWRFNRRYSFNRRPVIKRGNQLIWANRQLYYMSEYLVNIIFSGKLESNCVEMVKLEGKITKQRGLEFNELVYMIINDMEVFSLYKNVKKINGKKISDDKNKDLGDIDILLIDEIKGKIIAIEVKRFKYSKNPYEIYKEYQKMFVDSKEPSFATKHNKRVEWLRKHVSDIKTEYNLSNKNWTIEGIFVVNEPIISKDIYNKKIKCISISELNERTIRNIC